MTELHKLNMNTSIEHHRKASYAQAYPSINYIEVTKTLMLLITAKTEVIALHSFSIKLQ